MKNYEKADQLLRNELLKEEKRSGNEYTHNETLSEGVKLFTYYVIFNDGNENLSYFTYTVNLKTKKVSRKVRRANL